MRSGNWCNSIVECSAIRGERAARRRDQVRNWMRAMVRERLLERQTADPEFAARTEALEASVVAGEISPSVAVDRLLDG